MQKTCELCGKNSLSQHNKALVAACHACQISDTPRPVWVRLMADGSSDLALTEHMRDVPGDIVRVIEITVATRIAYNIMLAEEIVKKYCDENPSQSDTSTELALLDDVPTIIARALVSAN